MSNGLLHSQVYLECSEISYSFQFIISIFVSVFFILYVPICNWSAVLTQGHLLSRVKKGTFSLSADTQMCVRMHTFKVSVWECVLACYWMGVLKLYKCGTRCVGVCSSVCNHVRTERRSFFLNTPSQALLVGKGWVRFGAASPQWTNMKLSREE